MLLRERKFFRGASVDHVQELLKTFKPYNIWVDTTGWLSALSTPEGIVFYLAAVDYQKIKIISPEEAESKMLLLISRLASLSTRLPLDVAKVYRVHYLRIVRVHKTLFMHP